MPSVTSAQTIIIGVKAAIGEEAWDKLQSKTRTGIITSELCFSSFKTDTGFDFSSVIVPIMKGLELELRHSFYEPYLAFIKSNYATPKDYVDDNWRGNYPGDKTAAEQRSKILSFDGSSLKFQSLTREFTIGNVRYLIGATNRWNTHVDESFLKYCENDLFRGHTVRRKDIKKWIKNLLQSLEGLRRIRNDSSHAGKLQNVIDAKTVLDELIEVEKVMALIVLPPFLH